MAEIKQPMIDVKVHRRVLGFLNAARSPEDLMMPPPNEILLFDPRVMNGAEDLDEHPPSQDHAGQPKRVKPIMDRELAKRILRERDDYSPLHGFRHISQLQKMTGFDRAILDHLIKLFSPRFRGKWEVLYDAD